MLQSLKKEKNNVSYKSYILGASSNKVTTDIDFINELIV